MTIKYDLDEREYHAHPSLSASGAKLLLDSPAKFKHEVLDGNRTEKKVFDVGSAVHALVLGVGSDVVELEYDNYRTKAAQQARDEARDAGKVPMLTKDLAPVRAMAEAVLAHPSAAVALAQEGTPETSVFATDPELGIELRCRFDFLPAHHEYGIDVKTVGTSASPQGFAKQVAAMKYDVQEAHYGYTFGISQNVDPIPMMFIAVESNPPHLVGTYTLPPSWRDVAHTYAERARRRYAHGIRTGQWDGYPQALTELTEPVWHQYQAIDDQNEEDFG